MIYYKLTFILLHLQLLITISAESSDSNNDCSCPKEQIFDSNVKEGVFKSPGFPLKYCGSLDCKWNIQSAENTFIYAKLKSFETEENYDTLDVYQTMLNGSELMKVKQASLGKRYINSPCIHFSSSINGGLFFHFYTDGVNHSHSGFEIKFSRKSEDDSTYRPCPQPFHFASSSPQRLPKFDLKFSETCIFSINSTEAIKLTINRDNKTSFGIKVFETGNFHDPYSKDKEIQLAKVEGWYSPFQSFPLTVTSRSKSVSVIISSSDIDHHITPFEIEFVAVKPCKCFPSNLIVSRGQPLNLLSQGFPLGYCSNLNCFTEISLENPLNTRDEESLQIQLNSFQTDSNLEPLSLKIPFGEEKRELISFGSVLSKIKFLTVNSPKIFFNFTTKALQDDTGFNLTIKRIKRNKECSCHGTNSNFKILSEKNDSVQYTFDGVKCPFVECYWEIQPPKDSKIYHYLIVKLNLSHADDGDFVEECSTNFTEGSRGCSRYDSKNNGSTVEILVNDISRFILKRDASVRVWYHRESGEMIKNPNIPRQFHLNYEWREEPHPLLSKKKFNDI